MSRRTRLNQEMITNKALEIADRNGMETVTMAALAGELTIKSPSLYNHFKGLTEVKQAMSVKAIDLLYQHLKEAGIGKKEGSETIRAIGKAYIEFAKQHPGTYDASITAPYPYSENFQLAGEAIVGLIRESLSVYSLNEKEIMHVVRGLRSLLHGLVDLKRKGGFNLQVDIEDSQEMSLETFINGLNR
ncbi:TetR/AcrR family transcriptional regulator [Salibacterium halotolerans]|uniref:DNA-binding transcriptional regulator, AcrR family n=1 Tax=Salibacterium halotolerans TaxID=1884432 RepID=A0A1I5VZ83_9BACI|nr:TetR/AcrR family transcriptional regulator [Salibacterium halotolerans]SFQ12740.1 DNA-binding transcriptional regulator, AcrR family [Salibacterium halotolerans]